MELKAIRENAGLRQEDVAKKLRVRVSAVSNWERGVNGIASKYIRPLTRLYGVTEAEIREASEAVQAARVEKAMRPNEEN
nr:MAG TPA: Helix-turn-helix XRE-family like protein [Bacteriophage sp.]